MTTQRLAGKVALVTGAASGIGRAAALLFAAEGAQVAVADIDAAGAADVASEIASASGEAVAIAGDVSTDAGAGAIVAQALARLERVDVLVNSAGINANCRLVDVTDELVERLFSVNLKGTLFMAKHAARAMIRAGGGAIVNVASATAVRPRPDMPVYASTKGAVVSLTRSMAIDLAAGNIRVNAVSPGSTDTPMLDRTYAAMPDSEARRLRNIQAVPLKREGRSSEIGQVILFLASDEASYVTGQIVGVDGGTTAGTPLH